MTNKFYMKILLNDFLFLYKMCKLYDRYIQYMD